MRCMDACVPVHPWLSPNAVCDCVPEQHKCALPGLVDVLVASQHPASHRCAVRPPVASRAFQTSRVGCRGGERRGVPQPIPQSWVTRSSPSASWTPSPIWATYSDWSDSCLNSFDPGSAIGAWLGALLGELRPLFRRRLRLLGDVCTAITTSPSPPVKPLPAAAVGLPSPAPPPKECSEVGG